MSYIEELDSNKEKSLEIIRLHLDTHTYISNETFYNQVSKLLDIRTKNYANQLLYLLNKEGYITRVIKNYYSIDEIINTNFDKIILDIFLKSDNKNYGHYTGQYILNKYGFIDQVPSIIHINSIRSHSGLINFKYKITNIDTISHDYLYIDLLRSNPLVLDLLELFRASKMLSLEYSYEEIFSIFCKKEEIDEVDLSNMILKLNLPKRIYYNSSRAIQKIAKEKTSKG